MEKSNGKNKSCTAEKAGSIRIQAWQFKPLFPIWILVSNQRCKINRFEILAGMGWPYWGSCGQNGDIFVIFYPGLKPRAIKSATPLEF
jgi:hypothetical protein